MVKCFTQLGNDNKKYCFCISHEEDGDYLEVHKFDKNRMCKYDEKSFITRIPCSRILEYIRYK